MIEDDEHLHAVQAVHDENRRNQAMTEKSYPEFAILVAESFIRTPGEAQHRGWLSAKQMCWVIQHSLYRTQQCARVFVPEHEMDLLWIASLSRLEADETTSAARKEEPRNG